MGDDLLLSLANEAEAFPLRNPRAAPGATITNPNNTNRVGNYRPALAGGDNVPINRPGSIPVTKLEAIPDLSSIFIQSSKTF